MRKGQAMSMEVPGRRFHWVAPVGSGEAGTECCPQERVIAWAWHEQGTYS
ncbi:MAG: hypothetical protein OSJ55_10525 [Bacteroidales bacterium]|nr:hypothetical protein [Bacteroidales bacterium]